MGEFWVTCNDFYATNCLTECYNEWELTGVYDGYGCSRYMWTFDWRQPCDWEGIDEIDGVVMSDYFGEELWLTE